jgi:hypothetical protein
MRGILEALSHPAEAAAHGKTSTLFTYNLISQLNYRGLKKERDKAVLRIGELEGGDRGQRNQNEK